MHSLVNRENFSDEQLGEIENLELQFALSALQFLIYWIRDGFHNYWNLPFSVKQMLHDEQEQYIIQQLTSKQIFQLFHTRSYVEYE